MTLKISNRMAVIGKIRERSWILLTFLAISLFIFIIQSALESPSGMFNGGDKDSVGEIDDKNISASEFSKEVTDYEEGLKLINPNVNLDDNLRTQISDEVWLNMAKENLLDPHLKELGIEITTKELGEIMWGSNAHPLARNFWAQVGAVNQETGAIDEAKAKDFIKNIDKNDPNGENKLRAVIEQIEKLVMEETIKMKYTYLISKSYYVPTFFAKEVVNASREAVAAVLSVPLTSVPDSDFKIIDADITKYISENLNKYNQEASRTLDVVTFDIIPTQQDSLDRKTKIEDLRNAYLAITDKSKDTAFIERNSIQREQLAYYSKEDVSKSGRNADEIFSLPIGTTTPIYIENGSYVFTKILDRRVAPDSVHAAHILLSLGNKTEAEIASANKKADSLIQILAAGKANFGDLANQNSIDENSKIKGGDLGYFTRNQMVKEFNDQVFFKNMAPGNLAKVETQFGLHIILLLDARNPQLLTEFADFVEPIRPSKETNSKAYAEATEFMQKNNTSTKFDAAAKTEKLAKNIIITSNSSNIQNLGTSKDLIRWAFDEKEGKVGNIKFFDMSDKFIVAKINKVSEKGLAKASDVRDEVTQILINKKKADKIAFDVEKAADKKTDLASIATALKDAIIKDSVKVNFSSGLSEIGNEPKLSGAVFGTQIGKVSKVIKGNEGVYLVQPSSIQQSSPLLESNSLETYQKQMQQMASQQINYQEIIQSILDKSEVKDKRYTFF